MCGVPSGAQNLPFKHVSMLTQGVLNSLSRATFRQLWVKQFPALTF